MKRSTFIFISALLAWVFGLTMMLSPQKMLGNLTSEPAESANLIMQWVGVGLFSIGCINFLSRNDSGSQALGAIMIGNIILHILGLSFDLYDYAKVFIIASGLIMGIVVHGFLILGFSYYLAKMTKKINS